MTNPYRIRLPLVAIAATGALLAALLLAVAGTAPRAEAAPTANKNIVQTAVAAGQFKTLVALVKKAGLAGALSGSGKLTVFAPTDAAFKQVPMATLDKLGKDKALLRSVLLYHVAKGNVKAAQVVKLKSAPTLNGQRVRISVRGGMVYLNGNARVVKTDIAATNGTIHVVNRVLIPPAS
jgi:uncharacterized surface protein with fasciclin (FAS1) repeats